MLTHQYPLESYPTDEGLTEYVYSGGSLTLADGTLSGNGSKYIALVGGGTKTRLQKNVTIEPGETFAWSFFIRSSSFANWAYYAGINQWQPGVEYLNSWVFRFNNIPGNPEYMVNINGTNETYLIAIELTRSTADEELDGGVRLYVKRLSDGVNQTKTYTGLDTYDVVGGPVHFGNYYYNTRDSDFDEIRFGTSLEDVLPDGANPPAVDGEYPQAARTIFLFNQNDADSRTLAESVGLDEAMLCPLPCSSDESLSSYEDCQTQVENPLKSFLVFRPSVAAQATCIITGHNVPGYFLNDTDIHSTVSRLMNLDTAFAGAVSNPLYGSSSRLTATILAANNMYLAARLDASALSDCTDLKNLGDGNFAVTEGEIFYTTETPSLAEQLLRLPFETLIADVTIDNDAIVFVGSDPGSYTIDAEAAASRLAFIDGVAATHSRANISAMVAHDYSSYILAADNFDTSAFCTMLLSGGTIVEAFAVAIENLDDIAQLAAWPLMAASFPKAGYDVYVAPGSVGSIDYDDPTKHLPVSTESFDIDMVWDTQAVVVRRVGGDGQQETRGRVMLLEKDEDGKVYQQLPQPKDVAIRNIDPQTVSLSFTCHPIEGQSIPVTFKIFKLIEGEIDFNSTLVEIEKQFPGQFEFDTQLTISQRPVSFVVLAYDENGNTGPASMAATVGELRTPPMPSFTQE